MFKKRITPFTCMILVLLTVAVTFVAVSSSRSIAEKERLNALRAEMGECEGNGSANDLSDRDAKLSKIIDVIEKNYLRDYDETLMWDNIYRSLAISIGDRYSQYFTAEEYEALLDENDGDFVGIGVHATFDADVPGVYIFGVMPNSPAEKVGMQNGDVIISAEGLDTTADNYYDVLDVIRGEAGTEVNVTVLRGEEKIDFTLVRAAVPSENVIYTNLGDGIAYIRIFSFADTTLAAQFTTKMALAQSQGCDKFIFDVRNNSGGYLDAVCDALDLLLPEGAIINIVDKNGNASTIDSDANCISAEKMIVLCNDNTASAAELFSAALRDYQLAELVGTKTFGKGSMQTTYTLGDGSAIKMSTAYYNPPSNVSYDGIGIEPDHVIELPEIWQNSFYKMPMEEDTQLQKAIELVTSTN